MEKITLQELTSKYTGMGSTVKIFKIPTFQTAPDKKGARWQSVVHGESFLAEDDFEWCLNRDRTLEWPILVHLTPDCQKETAGKVFF